jgi:hypothetical protein
LHPGISTSNQPVFPFYGVLRAEQTAGNEAVCDETSAASGKNSRAYLPVSRQQMTHHLSWLGVVPD